MKGIINQMTKNDFIKKITSRKFLLSLISVISGILIIFGVDENTVSTVSGCAMVLLPSVIYCISEGKIDANRIVNISEALNEVLNTEKTENNDKQQEETEIDS